MAVKPRGRAARLGEDELRDQIYLAKHQVLVRGPDEKNHARETERRDAHHPTSWSVGDIDFDDDGSLFIRNPYLANAIERKLKENYLNYKPSDPKSFVFRLTRDEGFSGPKVNIVC